MSAAGSPVSAGRAGTCRGTMSASASPDILGRTASWRCLSARSIAVRTEAHVWLRLQDTPASVHLITPDHSANGVFLLGSVMWIYSVNMEAFALMDGGERTVPADRASPETDVKWT